MVSPAANCLRPSRTGGSSFTHGGSAAGFAEGEDENGEEEPGGRAGCATDGCLFLRRAVGRQKGGWRKGRDGRLERAKKLVKGSRGGVRARSIGFSRRLSKLKQILGC